MTKIEKLKNIISENDLDGLYIVNNYNVRYFTGFSGSSGVCLILKNENLFFTDFRYIEQAKSEIDLNDFQLIKSEKKFSETVSEFLKMNNIKKIGIEDMSITLYNYNNIVKTFENINLFYLGDRLLKIRAVKEEKEIELIRKAIEISEKSFLSVLSFISEGITEIEIAAELEYAMRKNGAQDKSFDTIVASGYRSAMPHGVASDKKIMKNEFVKIDFGCYFKGYASDITRTLFYGDDITDKHIEIYNIVLEAQKLAVSFAKAGITNKELDNIAREYIISKGYGEKFGHGLGHAVGLEVHEFPSLTGKGEEVKLEENMILTIEPGIYIEGFGGVRIEDDILIKKDCCEILTKKLSKELLIIKGS